jgi:hypothetical protein
MSGWSPQPTCGLFCPENIASSVTKKSVKRANRGFSLWGDEHGIKDALLLTPECACLNLNEF